MTADPCSGGRAGTGGGYADGQVRSEYGAAGMRQCRDATQTDHIHRPTTRVSDFMDHMDMALMDWESPLRVRLPFTSSTAPPASHTSGREWRWSAAVPLAVAS
eukprot:305734-Chlamydomonas_euryale.AAC.1